VRTDVGLRPPAGMHASLEQSDSAAPSKELVPGSSLGVTHSRSLSSTGGTPGSQPEGSGFESRRDHAHGAVGKVGEGHQPFKLGIAGSTPVGVTARYRGNYASPDRDGRRRRCSVRVASVLFWLRRRQKTAAPAPLEATAHLRARIPADLGKPYRVYGVPGDSLNAGGELTLAGGQRGAGSGVAIRVRASWAREFRPSFLKTLPRWYSTVRGLMNSWAAIWLFVSPSAARSATRASCGVRSRFMARVRARARSPVADSSMPARSANRSAPMWSNMSYAARSSRRASRRRLHRRSH